MSTRRLLALVGIMLLQDTNKRKQLAQENLMSNYGYGMFVVDMLENNGWGLAQHSHPIKT